LVSFLDMMSRKQKETHNLFVDVFF